MRLKHNVTPRRLRPAVPAMVLVVVALIAVGIGEGAGAIVASTPTFPAAAAGVGTPGAVVTTNKAEASFATVPLPSGYSIATQTSDRIDLVADAGRRHIIVSVVAEPSAIDMATVEQNVINSDRSTLDSNTQICADDSVGDATFTLRDTTLTGAYLPLCLTDDPQAAPIFPVRDYHYLAIAARNGGPALLDVEVIAPAASFSDAVAALGGYVPAISWDDVTAPTH